MAWRTGSSGPGGRSRTTSSDAPCDPGTVGGPVGGSWAPLPWSGAVAPNATGNVPTDDLVYMLERSGVETGISLQKVVDTSAWLSQTLGRELPALVPKAGIFPDNLRAAS